MAVSATRRSEWVGYCINSIILYPRTSCFFSSALKRIPAWLSCFIKPQIQVVVVVNVVRFLLTNSLRNSVLHAHFVLLTACPMHTVECGFETREHVCGKRAWWSYPTCPLDWGSIHSGSSTVRRRGESSFPGNKPLATGFVRFCGYVLERVFLAAGWK